MKLAPLHQYLLLLPNNTKEMQNSLTYKPYHYDTVYKVIVSSKTVSEKTMTKEPWKEYLFLFFLTMKTAFPLIIQVKHVHC